MNLSKTWVVLLLLLTACSDGGSADLYARERALPTECRGRNLTIPEAEALAAQALPTVPLEIVVVDAQMHNTRRDPVTGITTLKFVRGNLTTMSLAHELGHAAVFEAYKNTAPPGQPSTEKSVPVHGDEFVKAYKGFLAVLVSKECADGL